MSGPAPAPKPMDTATQTPAPQTAEPEPSAGLALRVVDDAVVGEPVEGRLRQVGSLPVTIQVATLDGGEIRVAEGPGQELALDMPDFSESDVYPRAVVSVVPSPSPDDTLAPGDGDFRFGLDFRLDDVSAGVEVDNGDNLLQRGLASDPAQYKLELDRGRPLCRVMGTEGAVEVKVRGERPRRGTWYRAVCAREDDSVTLTLSRYLADGQLVDPMVATGNGPIGELIWSKSQTPVAVGGKLAANGAVIKSGTDQFNGHLADPFVEMPEP